MRVSFFRDLRGCLLSSGTVLQFDVNCRKICKNCIHFFEKKAKANLFSEKKVRYCAAKSVKLLIEIKEM